VLDFEISTSPRAAGSPRAESCARRHSHSSEGEEDGDAPQCPQCARVFSLSAGRTPKVLPCQHLYCLECVVDSMHGSVAACAECGASHCLLAVAEAGSDFLVEAASSCPRELARRLPTCLILEELLSLLSPPRLPAGQATLLQSSTTSSIAGAPEAGTAGAACPRVAAPLSAEASPHSSSQPAGARAPAAGRSRLASDEFVFGDSVVEPAALNSRFCIRMQKLPADRTAAPADSLPSHTKKPGEADASPRRSTEGGGDSLDSPYKGAGPEACSVNCGDGEASRAVAAPVMSSPCAPTHAAEVSLQVRPNCKDAGPASDVDVARGEVVQAKNDAVRTGTRRPFKPPSSKRQQITAAEAIEIYKLRPVPGERMRARLALSAQGPTY